MKTKEANSVNEEEKETPLDTLYERSQTKNSTKKSKKAKVKEDPEEDATVSDEDEEEEDSQEEDDDDDEDDDEDDEDADASVSMQQSGSMKKARVRRNKQKQTSRKLWSNQVSVVSEPRMWARLSSMEAKHWLIKGSEGLDLSSIGLPGATCSC